MTENLSDIALLIIDMQEGLFGAQTPRYDSEGVINRINTIEKAVRENGGIVVFIQHDGHQFSTVFTSGFALGRPIAGLQQKTRVGRPWHIGISHSPVFW